MRSPESSSLRCVIRRTAKTLAAYSWDAEIHNTIADGRDCCADGLHRDSCAVSDRRIDFAVDPSLLCAAVRPVFKSSAAWYSHRSDGANVPVESLAEFALDSVLLHVGTRPIDFAHPEPRVSVPFVERFAVFLG